MGVITVDEYRMYSEVQPSEISDTTLQNIIEWISSELEEIFHTKFGSTEQITEYFDGEEKHFIELYKTGIVSIDEVAYHDGTEWVVLDPSEYFFNPIGLVELTPNATISYFPKGVARVRITYTYGYAVIPNWVKNLAVLMVDNRINYDRNRDMKIRSIISNHYPVMFYSV